ncbi:hypothetical protein HHL23_18520 [Chryseobacterium sp. RP-3-3]|uniref:Uncharacterized protein n=1 Tax=Chryseobacterium antibioticum TaxID=2728847 RepID=A0A7Y0FTF7_9FLAO|nr:hypothetical protein [Chryseobacterium antibioticum]NML71775.1 hypothetical protein [Chryseobacterium antibioticum]
MKKLLLPITLLLSVTMYSQVGIVTPSPDPSAMLDVVASDKGLLIPRVALTSATDQITVPSPAVGLLVYNTGAAALTFKGFPQKFTSGVLYSGNGTITYSVTGTPDFSSPSTATIPLSFLGANCSAIIGNNRSLFAVGKIKSARIIVPATPFITNGGTRNMMNGKATNNTTTTNRKAACELATAIDQSKFIFINGLRMDFLESATNGNVSPKFFNTLSTDLTYNVSSLSTYDANIHGANTINKTGYYSYYIDGKMIWDVLQEIRQST